MACLNSNTGSSSDPKILAEASDGLERVKVSCFFARADLKYINGIP
jgi:hypothetical protein